VGPGTDERRGQGLERWSLRTLELQRHGTLQVMDGPRAARGRQPGPDALPDPGPARRRQHHILVRRGVSLRIEERVPDAVRGCLEGYVLLAFASDHLLTNAQGR
jgi:hypothetical protein